MSREEARQLLDSQKGDERHALGVPVARRARTRHPTNPSRTGDEPARCNRVSVVMALASAGRGLSSRRGRPSPPPHPRWTPASSPSQISLGESAQLTILMIGQRHALRALAGGCPAWNSAWSANRARFRSSMASTLESTSTIVRVTPEEARRIHHPGTQSEFAAPGVASQSQRQRAAHPFRAAAAATAPLFRACPVPAAFA